MFCDNPLASAAVTAMGALLGVTQTALGGGIPLTTVLIADGIPQPLFVTHAPGDYSRLFVAQKDGFVRIVEDGVLLTTPFLDLSALINDTGERGLLGLAIHPDHLNNGLIYVNYTDVNGTSVIARYQASAADPNIADPASAMIVLTLEQPTAHHNVAWIGFGPDGYLWISTGDGGGGAVAAQDLSVLHGKMLRIDISGDDFPADPDRNYAIPPDNPFVGVPGVRDEIWSYGLRQPWRCSFDRQTGDLYIADVGGVMFEELNFRPRSSSGGENYGWPCMEGSSCGPLPDSGCTCKDSLLELPLYEYMHTGGNSITGGYVYRGCAIPDLHGTYFLADYVTGDIFALQHDGAMVTSLEDVTAELDPPAFSIVSISSFGEDAFGEIYICDLFGGEIFKIVPACPPDVNGDGAVNVVDLIDLLLCFGLLAEPPCDRSDVNGDGAVNVLDLILLLLAFGTTCP